MGLWNLLFGWGKRVDAAHTAVPAPKSARRRRKLVSTVESGVSRQCRFERMEERQMLDADPLKLGVVYIEEDGGSDLHGDTFELQFQGGHPGTELTRVVIDGDHGPQGISVGDMIFDTSFGGLGADHAFSFQVVSLSGGGSVTASVVDGSSQLILNFSGFHAGDKLRFSIDVDEIQQFEAGMTDLNEINSGVDPIASGVEFQDSLLTGTFKESHYYDVSGTVKFKNLYDPLFAGTNLLVSSGNPNGLPNDDFQGKRDRSTGTMLPLQQQPLPISISGYVYEERNLDLHRDAGEPPIAGVSLALWKKQGADFVFTGKTTTTDSQGFYKFGTELNLTPGVYQVRETQPAGYFSAGAIPGTVNGTATGSTVSGNPDVLTEINIPLGNQHAVRYDFAEYLPSSIRGHVHLTDRFGNCEEEGGISTPLSGVTLILKNAAGQTVATTQTNASGEYEFTNLLPGTYSVIEVTPAGLIDGDEHVGTISGVHVGVATDDNLGSIVLTGGQNGINYDFCEHRPSELSGYVYHDADNDGVYDAGEQPIPGTTVILLDAGGTQIAQQTTNPDGFYKFSGLSAGNYTIVEVQPAGWLDGKDAAGKIGGVTVGQAENPGDKIKSIGLLWGDVGVHYDFGELKPASISGKVFVDPNEDCLFNGNDRPLSGVTVQLLNAQGNVIQTTQTDANGQYRFDNLLPGTYAVRELQPAGFLQGGTVPGSGGGDGSVQDLITAIDIPSGAQLIEYNFCEIEPVSIAGRVWVDLDQDCVFDEIEQPLSGVRIELLDGNGIVVHTAFTDAQGRYSFVNLPPNNYSVHEFQPSGYFQGGQMAGSHGGDDSTTDLILDVNLFSGDQAINYDFCEQPAGSISGYVFRDGAPIFSPDGTVPTNLYEIRDGLLTPDDQRIGGVLLELRFSDTAQPVTSADVLSGLYAPGPIRVRTDASGYYEFRGLPAGNYTVFEVVQPAGYLDSRDTPGTTGGLALNQNTALIPGLIDPFIEEGVPLRNDAILQVSIAAGQQSVFNNFSEVQLTTFVIPPPPPLPPTPPPPEPQLFLPPVPVPPPLLVIPPPPPPEYFGGAGGVFTWHLSVVNAGLPRISSRSTKLEGLAWKPVLFVTGSQWTSEKLSGGMWTIDTLSPGVDRPIGFGLKGAIPITGDWDGDGTSEIGIFYKGEWLLDLNGNGKWDADDLWAKLGDEADLPVVGDWDGDGKDDIGIYGPEWACDLRHHRHEPGLPDPHNQLKKRPKNVPPQPEEATEGDRLLKLTSAGRERADLIDHVFYFGAESDLPIAGDWNGDGITSIGIFRDGQWHFDMDGDGRWSRGDQVAEFGQDGDLPVVGDFNGDGVDEIGIYRAGKWIIDTNGNRRIDAADQVIELGTASDLPVVGDFNGDGTDEPALYRESGPAKE